MRLRVQLQSFKLRLMIQTKIFEKHADITVNEDNSCQIIKQNDVGQTLLEFALNEESYSSYQYSSRTW